MQVQKRGLSPTPFLVLVMLIAFGSSYMFTHNGLVDLESEISDTQESFVQELKERYSLVADITLILRDYEIEQLKKEQLKKNENGENPSELEKDNVDIDDVETQHDYAFYFAKELEDEPMALGKDDKRVLVEEAIVELKHLAQSEEQLVNYIDTPLRGLLRQLEALDEGFNERRNHYNELANLYNETISSFPKNIVAFIARIKKVQLFPEI